MHNIKKVPDHMPSERVRKEEGDASGRTKHVHKNEKSHLAGLQKSRGKVVFFVKAGRPGGYFIRIGTKSYQLNTEKPLLVNRSYIGEIIEQNGQTLIMDKRFSILDMKGSIPEIYKEYSVRLVQLFIRNFLPLKKNNLTQVKKLIDRFSEDVDDDFILDAWQKGIPVEKIIQSVSEKRDRHNGRNDGDNGENGDFKLRESVKNAILRKKGSRSPLQMYNHIIKDMSSHWVHIPLLLSAGKNEIRGYLRLCVDVGKREMKKAVICVENESNLKTVCEINRRMGDFVLRGTVPHSLKNKKLGSGAEIVDIEKKDLGVFTGFGFNDIENALKGIDLDV